MAVQSGLYVSALSMLAGATMPMKNKEALYTTLLPKIRFYLNGLPVFLPMTFQDFTKQKDWEQPIIDFMKERNLNVYLAFGMVLQSAQIYPEKVKVQIKESGQKIGVENAILESLIHRLSITSSFDSRGELIDEFLMNQFGKNVDKKQSQSVWTAVLDAIELRPGIFGIKVDLKKLLGKFWKKMR